MSDGTPQPDGGLTPQEIRETIRAGAAEGAVERARRIIADAAAGPDEVLDQVMAVLKALAAGTLPRPVTVTAYAGLATATAVVGVPQVTVKSGGAAAGLYGEGILGISRANVPAAAELSGEGTLGIGPADVAAAANTLRAVGPPDVDKLAGRPPVRWSKQELTVNSLFLVVVVYWMLPPSARPVLTDIASLLQGIDAVVSLLRG
jgi:hypothetical protein